MLDIETSKRHIGVYYLVRVNGMEYRHRDIRSAIERMKRENSPDTAVELWGCRNSNSKRQYGRKKRAQSLEERFMLAQSPAGQTIVCRYQ